MNSRGFTLIEIAIVMVIIGLLTGAGVSMMGMLTQRKHRNETTNYLRQVREALISYANINGTLPWADTDADGDQNTGAMSGNIPFRTLQVSPSDPYKRNLTYSLNSNMGTDKATTCNTLRTGLSGNPLVVDADDPTGIPFPVAFIIISGGPMDADGNNNAFDAITSGTWQGDNSTGSPNYIRHPPTDTFVDLANYMGGNELYGEVCEYLVLAVNNNSGSLVYIYDQNQGSNLGSVAGGSNGAFNIISGTQIAIRDTAGNVAGSTPPTPIILAGNGCTIAIP